MKYKTIIFDFGGVLIDWNPRYLYHKIFDSTSDMEWFLDNVCTEDWNLQQDKGRAFQDAIQEKLMQFPAFEYQIRLFFERWSEMISGPIDGSVDILQNIDKKKYQLLGLTNWSAETMPLVKSKYSFFERFDGIVVSGEEKEIKPHRKIFDILIYRYKIDPGRSIYIDDNPQNIETSDELGFQSVLFQSSEELRIQLMNLGVQLNNI